MQFFRRHFRFIDLVALAAMLWLAALPTLSQALASATGQASGVEVCTTQGLRLVALDGSAPGSAQRPDSPAAPVANPGHCPLCSLAGGALGPPAAAAVPVPVAASVPHAPRDAHGPVAENPWRGAQPRAPPASA